MTEGLWWKRDGRDLNLRYLNQKLFTTPRDWCALYPALRGPDFEHALV